MINEEKLQKMEERERIAFLRAHADICEEKKVPVPLSEEERAESEHQVTKLFVEMNDLQIEKRELDKELNDRIKEKREMLNNLADEVKTGARFMSKQTFELFNDETGRLEEYTQDGIMLNSRRAPSNHQRGLRQVEDNRAVNE